MTEEEKPVRQVLYELLRDLRMGDCWCGVGIDNPNYGGKHSPQCVRAQVVFSLLKKECGL